jgi:catechol 2,3-dioxygenase-like lactoylglutathione lyase family enzyme
MSLSVNHLHLKSRDPKQTAQFYIDNFGATMIGDVPGRGVRVMLHGLQLNITTIIAEQTREQQLGYEHVALNTDDYPGTMAKFRANGVRVLEELPPGANGRRVAFVETLDGMQVEIIEKV